VASIQQIPTNVAATSSPTIQFATGASSRTTGTAAPAGVKRKPISLQIALSLVRCSGTSCTATWSARERSDWRMVTVLPFASTE
jgi:hypothetical protein